MATHNKIDINAIMSSGTTQLNNSIPLGETEKEVWTLLGGLLKTFLRKSFIILAKNGQLQPGKFQNGDNQDTVPFQMVFLFNGPQI